MALTSALQSAASALTPAKLEKARLEIVAGADARTTTERKVVSVQFNPSEYTLERSVSLAHTRSLGGADGPEQGQAPASEPARLTVPLYFDTITDLHSVTLSDLASAFTSTAGLTALAKDQFLRSSNNNPAAACAEIMQLVKFARQSHQPPKVNFLWGTLDFVGVVESATAQYTMFSPAGTPVKARVNLVIVGEERAVLQQSARQPNESPDRTKERTLAQGDQLWMIAGQEYDDPGQWKVIAQANGILNPRKLEKAAVLKVPSIK